MSRFAPVHLPEDRKLDGRVSMTFLRHFNACPRSGLMYQSNKGSVQNVAMARGSALHTICERATKLMIAQGEQIIPPELVKDIVTEVLAESPVPIEEHDRLREMSYRWATEWAIEPANVVACETLFVLEIGGWKVRAKVDFAELRDEGRQLYIADFKSGLGVPSWEDIARKRNDGLMAAKNLQLIVYALAVIHGRATFTQNLGPNPPAIALLQGDGEPQTMENGDVIIEWSEDSRGARAQDVIAEFIYPSVEDSEGKMLRRTMGLTSLEIIEYLESLSGLVKRVEASQDSGDWPAIISSSGCAECPAPSECPIPAALRGANGTIETMEQARDALELIDRQSSVNRQTRAAVKAWAKEHDVEIRFGADKVARFVLSETENIDKGALFHAMSAGAPVSREEIVTVSKGTNFKDCKLTADELEENSNGVE